MFGFSRSKFDELRHLNIFRNLSENALQELCNTGVQQRLPLGIMLTREGQRPDALHVPVDGVLELFSSHDDRETTLMFVQPGSSFSLGSVLFREPYLESSRSMQSCRVISFPLKVVHHLLETDSSFARAISDELALSTRRYVRELKNQKLRTSLERLAAWILKTDNINGRTGRFRISFGKKTLASHLGMTPENLSRTFAHLKESAIEMTGREIRITRRPALEQIAKLSHMID